MKPLISCFVASIAALLISGCAVPAAAPAPASADIYTRASVAHSMRAVADWQIASWRTAGFKKPKYNWTYCAAYTGIFETAQVTGDARYTDFLRAIGDDLGWQTGKRRHFADDYCIGQVYALMYGRYKEERMIAPWKALANEIVALPHTESLSLATGDIMEREWAWCDALFMGPTSLAYLGEVTGDPRYLDKAMKLWAKTTDFLYSPADSLYYRDESYFAKRERNGEKVFWSRGNGWVMGGLVRVLSVIPADHPQRAQLLQQYRAMAKKVASLQTADGSWHSSLLDPDSYPVKETSGTGFYTYAILWGLNNGVLEHDAYWPVVERSWRVLTESVQSDGKLGFVQPVGAAPDRVDADSTETYGPGAFLLAGGQMARYLKR